MAETVKGINIKFGADTIEFDNSIKGVNNSLRLINSNIGKVNQQLKLDPKNVELLKQKFQALDQKLDVTKEKLKLQQEELKNFAAEDIGTDKWTKQIAEIETTESKILSLSRQLENLNSKIKAVDNGADAFRKIGKSAEEAGKNIENAGRKLAPLSAATGVGLTLAAKSAIDFESAMAGVRKTVDGTEEQMKGLESGIRQLATEIPASTTEIAAVAEAAGQLGIQTDNILGFTRVMLDLGESTNLSAEEASTALARFANITGMSQTDFDRLGSTIVALGNNFATTEREITEMSLRLAGAGSQVGLSENEILGLSTALSSVGIEAEAGGSAFSKVLVKMQLATETSGQALTDFASVAGMTAEEFKTKFEDDAAGALLAFIDGLSKTEETGVSAIKVLDDMGITETRMRDALLRSANASDLFSEALTVGSSAWSENTALTKEAEQRYNTLASKIDILKNVFVDLAIEIGQVLAPVLNVIIEKAKEVLMGFRNMSESQKKMIVIVAALTTALAPMLMAIGKLVQFGGLVMTKIAGMSQALSVSVGAITGVGAAIAALVAIFVYLYATSEEFRNKVNDMVSAIADSLQPVFESLVNFIKTSIIPIFLSLMPIFEMLFSKLIDVITKVVIPIFNQLWAFIQEFIMPIFANMALYIQDVVVPVIMFFVEILTSVIDVLINLYAWFAEYILPIILQVAGFLATVFNVVFTTLIGILKTVVTFLQKLFEWIGKVWEDFKKTKPIQDLISFFEKLGDIIDTVKNAIASVVDWLGSLTSGVSDFFSSVGNFVGGIFSSGGFGTIEASLNSNMASGGIGTLVLNSNINVDNHGRPVNDSEIDGWVETLTDKVSYELGRRLF